MTRRALVTGGTGLLGSHIVERLIGAGWTVRAVVRDATSAAWLADLGAELREGDVLDAAAIESAVRGCSHVFHAAAAIMPRGGYASYRTANIDGTANVLRAAGAAGARLLHVSSVAVYGPTARYREGATDEAAPLAPLDDTYWYASTKRDSERMVLEAHAAGRLWAAAIRPCVIYGRRDRYFIPGMARFARRGIVPLPGGGRTTLAIIHASNVADAAVLAATADVAGGRAYNVANETPVTGREFFQLAGEGLGRPVRVISVPVPVARLTLGVVRMAMGLASGRGAASLASGSLGFITRDNPFSSERARRELGWLPRMEPAEAIPDAFRWIVSDRASRMAIDDRGSPASRA